MKEKTLFEEMKESGSRLPEVVKELVDNGWKTKNHHDNWVHTNWKGEYNTHEAFKLIGIKSNIENDLPNAIKVLQKHLSEDKSEGSYYHAFQCNIAMAFKDEHSRQTDGLGSEEIGYKQDIHEIADQAAKNFLDLFIKQ